MSLYLFAYDSLRPGQCNYGQLSEAVTRSWPWRVPGHLLLRPEGYPALILAAGVPQALGSPYDWSMPALVCDGAAPNPGAEEEWVAGDLLELEDSLALRERLDDFEGFSGAPYDYLRVALECGGRRMWTYVAPQADREWRRIRSWPPSDEPLRPWGERRRQA
jgi:gamma-glutamylcyclotransferase (GGCT)/AIG2-like uncharacterized protein YtfP